MSDFTIIVPIVRELGSFAMLILIFIQGVKYLPRAMITMEEISSCVKRIEDKIDRGN